MCVRGVGRSLEHLVIQALIEEGLSDVYQVTGVRNERSEAKSQSWSAEIECMVCTDPFSDCVQSL